VVDFVAVGEAGLGGFVEHEDDLMHVSGEETEAESRGR
jgi:hypothetical protein